MIIHSKIYNIDDVNAYTCIALNSLMRKIKEMSYDSRRLPVDHMFFNFERHFNKNVIFEIFIPLFSNFLLSDDILSLDIKASSLLQTINHLIFHEYVQQFKTLYQQNDNLKNAKKMMNLSSEFENTLSVKIVDLFASNMMKNVNTDILSVKDFINTVNKHQVA